MNIILRKIKIDDIDNVVSFFNELKDEKAQVSFSEAVSKDLINEWILDNCIYLYIAEVDNNIVAVFKGKKSRSIWKSHSAFLTCAVKKEFRGYGIAKKLTLYSLDELKKEGIKIARAYIYSDNISSISTILKCGFTLGGSVHMHHFSEKNNCYVDDMIFHKILT